MDARMYDLLGVHPGVFLFNEQTAYLSRLEKNFTVWLYRYVYNRDVRYNGF